MKIQSGEMVAVGGKVGQVRYITADGWIGVALVNETGRVDEWQASQVRAISTKEAARMVTA